MTPLSLGLGLATSESGRGNSSTPVYATLTTSLAGDNNDLVFTAKEAGASGEAISIQIATPGLVPNFEISVTDSAILITAGTFSGMTVAGAGSVACNGPYALKGVVNSLPAYGHINGPWSIEGGSTWDVKFMGMPYYAGSPSGGYPSDKTYVKTYGLNPAPTVSATCAAAAHIKKLVESTPEAAALVTVALARRNNGTGPTTSMAKTNLALP